MLIDFQNCHNNYPIIKSKTTNNIPNSSLRYYVCHGIILNLFLVKIYENNGKI